MALTISSNTDIDAYGKAAQDIQSIDRVDKDDTDVHIVNSQTASIVRVTR